MDSLGRFFFRYRSFTPIPLILLLLLLANPSSTSYVVGLILVVGGEALRLWGVGYAGGFTRNIEVSAPYLVTTGPFAYVRNPLYLGNFLLSFGLVVAAWAWMPYFLFLLVTVFFVQYVPIIRLEEKHLEEAFGADYLAYKRNVPSFLPRLVAHEFASPHGFDLGQAFRSEKRSLQSVVIVLLAILVRAWIANR